MHLAGKANAGDLRWRHARLLQQFCDSGLRSLPPIVRILLGPTRLGRLKGLMVVDGRCYDCTRFIDEEGARTTSADIDSQKLDGSIPRLSLCDAL